MDTTIENMINSIDLSAPVPEYEPMRQYYYLKACRKIVKEKSEALNRPLTAVVSTFGCQMNARDSEKLLGILKDIGYQESDDEENADFVIYNTCTVRENANLRVYGRLGQLKKVKRANGEMIIAMCGCMMQEPEVVEKIKTSYKFVDIVFGTFNIFKLNRLLIYGILLRRLLRSFQLQESIHLSLVSILCLAVITSVHIVLFHMCEAGRNQESQKR